MSKCAGCGKEINPFGRLNWCLDRNCYNKISLNLLAEISEKLREGDNEKLIRLESQIQRLLVGMKDAKFYLDPARLTNLNYAAALSAIEKAAKEIGREIPI